MVICAFNHKTLLDMGRCNDKEIDTSVDNDLILRYKISLRLHLGYCVWNPHLRKNAGVLEKVQRGQTSMIEVLGKLNYEERLKRYKLTTLEKKGSKANLIEVFKIEEGGFCLNSFAKSKKIFILESIILSCAGRLRETWKTITLMQGCFPVD